ncbi:hypothetical protein [Ruminococcus gauvreauii]|uniref:Transposase n=1 Tax=Ruminococcus gauvreauii TaxID=438033 RepID=A0ABY5VIN6_9FIRM|nr:hypothetical protein [Ruminococcus gauvreauii]UWP60177.1 hypothetical protein NQ502_03740 [Ruminococcus gauvreauii]
MNITFIIKLKSIIVNAYLKKIISFEHELEEMFEAPGSPYLYNPILSALMENGLQED